MAPPSDTDGDELSDIDTAIAVRTDSKPTVRPQGDDAPGMKKRLMQAGLLLRVLRERSSLSALLTFPTQQKPSGWMIWDLPAP